MITTQDDTVPIATSDDVVRVRQEVRVRAIAIGMGLVDQTKIVTAASELARNTLDYGGGGTARLEVIEDSGRRGVRLTFEDQGPGIVDIDRALSDGFTSGGGLGLGLGGAKRLTDAFEIRSVPGEGTCVSVTRWK